MTQKLHFKTHAQIKSVVGKDLILDDNVAIIELVKNSYDAQSQSVSIEFVNIKDVPSLEKSKIIIRDYGTGMDLESIKNKWLNIAYSEKKGKPTQDGRAFAGSKGIGRFSCDRLGKTLDLYTRKPGESYIHLHIDWLKFEIDEQDKEIHHIPVLVNIIHGDKFREASGFDEFDQGTILEIKGLRRAWPKPKLLGLKAALEKFSSPNQEFQENTFKINLKSREYQNEDNHISDEEKRINGQIRNKIFEKLYFKATSIDSEIDPEGLHITTSLTHRGDTLFTLVEKNRFSELKRVKLSIFFLNQYHKAYFKRQTGFSSLEYGSMFLFLNNFRVHPYGERGNDWLGLDSRKIQQYGRLLGTRDLLGRIEITDPKGQWQITSSREGLVEDDAFDELTDINGFFYSSLKKLEKYVVGGLEWDSTFDMRIDASKIFMSNWDQGKEKYKETEAEKERRIISMMQDIILAGTKQEDIELIEFNPQVVRMLAEQDEQAVEDFFSNFKGLAKVPTKESLYRNLDALKDALQEERGRQKAALLKATKRVRELAKEKEELQAKYNESESQRKTFQRKSRQQEEMNLFLKATASRDLDDVIEMHHQIIISASIIQKDTDSLLSILDDSTEEVPTDSIKKIVERISFQNNKILQFSNFATRANFKISVQELSTDILRFISRYVNEITSGKYFRNINVSFSPEQTRAFVIKFKPIEITIIIDNLIKNAEKASAKNFHIDASGSTKDCLDILFEDDGEGLSGEVSSNSDIFERGFTTTSGSGIGLYHVKKIVKALKGTMDVDTSRLGGFALRMRIEK